jgi:hypothetical protein
MVQSLQCVLYLLNLLIIKNLNKAGKLIVMFLVRGAVVVQKETHRARDKLRVKTGQNAF